MIYIVFLRVVPGTLDTNPLTEKSCYKMCLCHLNIILKHLGTVSYVVDHQSRVKIGGFFMMAKLHISVSYTYVIIWGLVLPYFSTSCFNKPAG